jgi:uncharacterized protein (TIGR02118 family)
MKVFLLANRRSGVELGSFENVWMTPTAPSVAGLRRHVRSHQRHTRDSEARSTTEWAFGSAFPYDGIAELWFDDFGAWRSAEAGVRGFFDAEMREVVDLDRMKTMVAEENVVVAGPGLQHDTPAVKALFFPSRKPGMSVPDFQEYWRTKHADIVPNTPKLMRYVQSHMVPEMYEDASQPYSDGVAELWWATEEDVHEGLTSDAFQKEQPEDASHFVDPNKLVGVLTEEARIVWP